MALEWALNKRMTKGEGERETFDLGGSDHDDDDGSGDVDDLEEGEEVEAKPI